MSATAMSPLYAVGADDRGEDDADQVQSKARDAEFDGDPRTAAVARVGDQLGSLMRLMGRAKAQFLADPAQRDFTSLILIARVVHDGPQRVSSLAETIHCDVSTASRQVAALVKEGLLERTADPEDGRASLLTVTEAGRAAAERFRAHRAAALADMLDDWTTEEAESFASDLERFRHNVEGRLPGAMASASMHTTQPVAPRGATPEEN